MGHPTDPEQGMVMDEGGGKQGGGRVRPMRVAVIAKGKKVVSFEFPQPLPKDPEEFCLSFVNKAWFGCKSNG